MARAAASDDPMLGKIVGRYLLESRLGAGGMATVYRARDHETVAEGSAVAISATTL